MSKILSIVIPVYKVEEYIDKCLMSLIVPDKRLLQLLDVVVINDGTPDMSAIMAKKYEELYPDVVRVIDQDNRGHGGAWNHGTELAVGKYLFYLDSDDWFDTQELSKLIEYLEHADTDMVLLDGQIYYAESGKFEERTAHLTTVETDRIYKSDEFDWCGCGIGWAMTYAHDTVYRTAMMKRYLPLFCEHVMYDDVSLQFVPIVISKDFVYIHCNVYRYYIGRPGQSFDPKVRAIRAANDVTKVLMFCLEWIVKYRTSIPQGGECEKWLENSYQSLCTWHYYELSLFSRDIAKSKLREWDVYVKSNHPNVKPDILVWLYRSLPLDIYFIWFKIYHFNIRTKRYIKRKFNILHKRFKHVSTH